MLHIILNRVKRLTLWIILYTVCTFFFFNQTDAIILNINTELFNLTKAEYMFDETSYGFLWLMNTFCQDVSQYILLYPFTLVSGIISMRACMYRIPCIKIIYEYI